MYSSQKILNGIHKISDFYFSKYTTYGLGGKAKEAFFPESEEEAIAVFNYLLEKGEKFIVLGNGSNILASNKPFDGAVICTKFLKGIKIVDDNLKVLCGTTVSELLSFCQYNGIGGFEYLAGIPASIGGLAFMNGGINGRHICDDIISVRLYDGKTHDFLNKECNFSNKHSTMRDINNIILSVLLKYKNAEPQKICDNISQALIKRRSQPKGKSCGCVFKNPDGYSAGKLIDEAGLKGATIGCAEVSMQHANFIINNGANSDDVYSLIQFVKDKVYEKTHILLEEEVVYIGEFNDTDR